MKRLCIFAALTAIVIIKYCKCIKAEYLSDDTNSALPVTAAVISAVSGSNTPETAITISAYLRNAAILTVWLIRKYLILVCFLLTGNAEKYLSGVASVFHLSGNTVQKRLFG